MIDKKRKNIKMKLKIKLLQLKKHFYCYRFFFSSTPIVIRHVKATHTYVCVSLFLKAPVKYGLCNIADKRNTNAFRNEDLASKQPTAEMWSQFRN